MCYITATYYLSGTGLPWFSWKRSHLTGVVVVDSKEWVLNKAGVKKELLGRPRTAWVDNIKTWTGLSVEESIRMTEDRDKWRKYVHGVANPRIEDG